MSNSIWKTPDQKPDTDQHVLFFAGGGIFPYLGFYYPKFDTFNDWKSKDVQRWASVFEVIAQADKAERLQKAVDNIKETNDAMMRVLGKQVAEESTDDEEYCWYSCCRIKDYLQALDCTETVKPKSGIPHNALCYFQDGDMVCCVFGDFVNLQESPAGFGKTNEEAFEDLKRNWDEIKQLIKGE